VWIEDIDLDSGGDLDVEIAAISLPRSQVSVLKSSAGILLMAFSMAACTTVAS
jgi:hypothetical protein